MREEVDGRGVEEATLVALPFGDAADEPADKEVSDEEGRVNAADVVDFRSFDGTFL